MSIVSSKRKLYSKIYRTAMKMCRDLQCIVYSHCSAYWILFGDVLVAAVVMICLRSLLRPWKHLWIEKQSTRLLMFNKEVKCWHECKQDDPLQNESNNHNTCNDMPFWWVMISVSDKIFRMNITCILTSMIMCTKGNCSQLSTNILIYTISIMCSSRKYPYPPQGRLMEIPRGRGVSFF